MSQLEVDLGSKPPHEQFAGGSQVKGERQKPQAGGYLKSFALGQKPKEASPTWKMLP